MITSPFLSRVLSKEKAGAFFCIGLMLPSLLWVWLDKRVWPWDQAEYGYYSVWLWKYLTINPLDWWDAMMLTLRLKTPGLPWLAQFATPLGDLSGFHDSIFLTLIVLISILSLILVFLTARSVFPGKNGLAWFCPLALAAAPLFSGMNQQFLVEAPQMMAICWLLLIISRLDQWPLRAIFWHTAAAFIWGCLMKVTFPLYALIPVSYIAIHTVRRLHKNPDQWSRGKLRRIDLAAMGFTIFGGIAALMWLVKNFDLLWLFIKINAQSQSGAIYGSASPFSEKIKFWLSSIIESYFTASAFLAVFLLILIFAFLQWKSVREFFRKKTARQKISHNLPGLPLCLVCTASFLLALIIHSSQANEISRFLTPLLPFFVFFLAGILSLLNNRVLIICVFTLFSFQYIFVHAHALGFLPNSPGLSEYLWRLDRDDTRSRQITETIEQTAARPESANRWIMAGCSVPTLSRNTLSYYMMKNKTVRNQDTQIFSYNFGESDLRKLVGEIKAKRPVYFITVPAESIPDGLPRGLNLISPALLEAMNHSPWYEKVTESPAPDILIFKIRDEYYLPASHLQK